MFELTLPSAAGRRSNKKTNPLFQHTDVPKRPNMAPKKCLRQTSEKFTLKSVQFNFKKSPKSALNVKVSVVK